MLGFVIQGHGSEHAVQHCRELTCNVTRGSGGAHVARHHTPMVLSERRVPHVRRQQDQRHLAKRCRRTSPTVAPVGTVGRTGRRRGGRCRQSESHWSPWSSGTRLSVTMRRATCCYAIFRSRGRFRHTLTWYRPWLPASSWLRQMTPASLSLAFGQGRAAGL